MSAPIIQKLLQDFLDTRESLQQEENQRQEITRSEEFSERQKKIDALMKENDELLAAVPDSSEEHEMDKAALLKHLNENKVTDIDGFKLKMRKSQSVNTTKVLRALDGDLDQFFLIAHVTQKALTDYAKLHPELKKLFSKAVEIDSMIVTEVTPNVQ